MRIGFSASRAGKNSWWDHEKKHLVEGRNLLQKRMKGKGETRSEMRRRSQQQLFQKETKASELGEMIKKKKNKQHQKTCGPKRTREPVAQRVNAYRWLRPSCEQ